MHGSCGMHGKKQKCLWSFGQKTWRKYHSEDTGMYGLHNIKVNLTETSCTLDSFWSEYVSLVTSYEHSKTPPPQRFRTTQNYGTNSAATGLRMMALNSQLILSYLILTAVPKHKFDLCDDSSVFIYCCYLFDKCVCCTPLVMHDNTRCDQFLDGIPPSVVTESTCYSTPSPSA